MWCGHRARFTYPHQLSHLNQLTMSVINTRLRNYGGLENAWPQHAGYTHTHTPSEPDTVSLRSRCYKISSISLFVQSKINSLVPRDTLTPHLHRVSARGQHSAVGAEVGIFPDKSFILFSNKKQGYQNANLPSKPNFVSFSLRCLNCISHPGHQQ